ncbi:hypothetical protein MMC08_005199 [Hypocenomyce scalaris]|nr:hypothetical protein [Hypocenomyce scalaris]
MSEDQATSREGGGKRIALTNVRVFDGHDILPPTTVIIDGGFIGNDETGAEVIDGKGGILLPGLIDCHVHLLNVGHLELLADYGVTTALDMGMNSINLLRELKGRSGLTDIRGCGMTVTRPGSRHSRLPGRSPESLVSNADQAKQFVANRVAEGVDYIKIIVDVPAGPDQETVNALVAAAHDHGKLTIAHASSFPSVSMAQEAQVDILTHSPMDRELDEASVKKAVAENRIIVPTLSMMEGIVKNGKIPNVDFAKSRASVTALYQAGVPILAGTDANAAPGVPAQIPHGDSLHHELELLVEAGLSTLDALKAATSLPAKYFGLSDRGEISPGKRADLILIQNNPLEDIRATRSILRVWCGGIERQGIAAKG